MQGKGIFSSAERVEVGRGLVTVLLTARALSVRYDLADSEGNSKLGKVL